MKSLIIPFFAIALAVAGCQSGSQKETVGTLGGAAAGGLIGSQFGDGTGNLVATGLGVAAGAFLGNQIGQSLDKADRAEMNQAYSQAQSAPVGQTITWSNPQSGNRGRVTPIRDGRSSSGDYCREYRSQVLIDGEWESATSVACRDENGNWEMVS